MSDEASDLSAAAAGDAEAFARLYDRHEGIVLSLCRRRSWSMDEAQDAAQETFMRAYLRLPEVRAPAMLRPWLYAIARHVCRERRRAASHRTQYEMNAARNRRVDSSDSSASAPVDAVEHAEQLERLTVALEALPDRQRLAIHLYYLDADPVAVASQALGVTRKGFYKLLARARRRLAVRMREGAS